MRNRKFTAMFFSIIPGAGHMYLNLPKQGIQLMSLFFFTIFISSWLHFGFLGMFVPIIWFYSFFDAGHKAKQDQPLVDGTLEILKGVTPKNYISEDLSKILGYGLIIIGIIVFLERTLFPVLINLNFSNTFRTFIFSFRNYLHTGIASAILIIGGIKLLSKSKVKSR
jgi:hypothetical protein